MRKLLVFGQQEQSTRERERVFYKFLKKDIIDSRYILGKLRFSSLALTALKGKPPHAETRPPLGENDKELINPELISSG